MGHGLGALGLDIQAIAVSKGETTRSQVEADVKDSATQLAGDLQDCLMRCRDLAESSTNVRHQVSLHFCDQMLQRAKRALDDAVAIEAASLAP